MTPQENETSDNSPQSTSDEDEPEIAEPRKSSGRGRKKENLTPDEKPATLLNIKKEEDDEDEGLVRRKSKSGKRKVETEDTEVSLRFSS